jgi:restriction system protein
MAVLGDGRLWRLGKPIELLSGSNLLYLLAEHAGMEAKIEVPEDWIDPVPTAEL